MSVLCSRFFFVIFLSVGLINANMDNCADDIYTLITGFIIYHVVLLTIQNKKDLENVFLAIILCAPLLTIQGGLQFLTALSLNPADFSIRASGWWIDPNTYAFILNLIYLVSFYFLEKEQRLLRWLGYFAQVFITIGILTSLSRGGLLIFFVITFLNLRSLWKRKSYLFVLLILIIVFFLVCVVNIFSLDTFENYNIERLFFFGQENLEEFSNGRLATALTGLMIYTLHPLVGAGFGNILDYANMLNHFRLYTHNMYIEILAVSGPLPLLCYLFMLMFLWYSTFRTKTDGLQAAVITRHFIIALAVMGVFSHYLLYLKPIWILLALCPVVCRLNRGEEDAFGNNHFQV